MPKSLMQQEAEFRGDFLNKKSFKSVDLCPPPSQILTIPAWCSLHLAFLSKLTI